MLRREVINLARDLAVDIARVEHQYLVAAPRRLGPIEVPELAGHATGVEEIGADGDHHIHIAGLDQLAAHFLLAMPGAGSLRRHHEASAARRIQIAPEVRDPEIIAIADILLLVHTRQAKRQARICFDALGVHQVDVERRIGHHEITLADERVRVGIVGDGLTGNLAFQAMYREVHDGETGGSAVLLMAVEHHALGGIQALVFDEMTGLYKHAA